MEISPSIHKCCVCVCVWVFFILTKFISNSNEHNQISPTQKINSNNRGNVRKFGSQHFLKQHFFFTFKLIYTLILLKYQSIVPILKILPKLFLSKFSTMIPRKVLEFKGCLLLFLNNKRKPIIEKQVSNLFLIFYNKNLCIKVCRYSTKILVLFATNPQFLLNAIKQ